MNLEVNENNITSVTIGKRMLYLKDLNTKDLPELQEHVAFFEKHLKDDEEGLPWKEEEIKVFVEDSSKQQKEMLKILTQYPDGIKTTDLIKKLGYDAPQAIAGLRAGFTRRTAKVFGKKSKIVESEWNPDEGMHEYWINEDYFPQIKKFMSEEN